jgi:hypothetical protein
MFKVARVVATHPESHAVDVVVMDDNRRLSGVQVLAGMAGGNVGLSDLPEPTVTDPQRPFESSNTNERDIYAVVAFVGAIPLVVGFLYPQVAECLFASKNFRVNRHASDVYYTIDGAGNIELAHPSGTYIRIGETLDHVDLTGQDYDQKWKTAKNTDKLPGLRVQVANSGGVKTTFTIDKDGNVAMTTAGTLSMSSAGNMTLHSDGDMAISATGDINVTGANINLN